MDHPPTFAEAGFAIVDNVLDDPACDRLIEELAPWQGDGRAGRRGVLDEAPVRRAIAAPRVRELVGSALGTGAFAVRALLFDKTPDANWSIRWHQDHAIAVAERKDVDGFRGWSQKDVLHVQAPTEIIATMLAVRLHLDDADAQSGALRVIPGAFRERVAPRELRALAGRVGAVTCTVRRGGALLMRPSLAHTSSRSDAVHRRVLHVEFANRELPGGLRWARRVPVT